MKPVHDPAAILKSLPVSLRDVAKRARVSGPYLSQVIHGHRPLSDPVATRLIRALEELAVDLGEDGERCRAAAAALRELTTTGKGESMLKHVRKHIEVVMKMKVAEAEALERAISDSTDRTVTRIRKGLTKALDRLR